MNDEPNEPGPAAEGRGTSARVPYLITGGGDPSPAEHVAIAQALARWAEDGQETGGGSVPAWTRAALREGTRRVTVTRPPDLQP